jgi:hypothetical protein
MEEEDTSGVTESMQRRKAMLAHNMNAVQSFPPVVLAPSDGTQERGVMEEKYSGVFRVFLLSRMVRKKGE